MAEEAAPQAVEAAPVRINGVQRKGEGLRAQDSPLPKIASGKLDQKKGFAETLSFLQSMIHEPACRYVSKGQQFGKLSNCTCLHKLRPAGPDDAVAHHRLRMIAAHCVQWASMNAQMRMQLALEWYLHASIYAKQGKPLNFYFPVRSSIMFEDSPDADFWDGFEEMEASICHVFVCQNALRTLFGYGQDRWQKVIDAHKTRRVLPHGLKGKKSNRRNIDILSAEERLNSFFESLQQESAEVPATRMVRCLTGAALRKEEEDLVELPSYFTKRGLYKRFMFDGGWLVATDHKGNIKVKERDDDVWTGDNDRQTQPQISWKAFRNYWKEHYPKMSIRAKSEDVCGECTIVSLRFKYNSFKLFVKSNSILPNTHENELYDILKNSYCQPTNQAQDGDSSADGHGQRRDGDGAGVADEDAGDDASLIEKDKELLVAALEHVKADGKQRARHRYLQQQSIASKLEWKRRTGQALRLPLQARQEKLRHLLKFHFTADYCQNLAIPFLGANQFGESYYWSPMWVYAFGIADETNVDGPTLLEAFYYFEDEGFKGGNNVVSLIHKFLVMNNMLNKDDPIGSIAFSFDNCGGQNKNQIVLGYFDWLKEQGYFLEIHVVFLVRGHTKNACDRMYNLLKTVYRNMDVYSSKQLHQVLNTSKDVQAHKVEKHEFLNWSEALKPIFSMPKSQTKKNHNFSFYKSKPNTIAISKYDGETVTSYSCKARGGVAIRPEERLAYVQTALPPAPEEGPVLRSIKHEELYDKWRQFVPVEHRIDWWFRVPPTPEATAKVKADKKASKKRRMDERTQDAPAPAAAAAAAAAPAAAAAAAPTATL